ncbi:hypothetical protein H9P43_003799 [Blastocladiella emersonii ATCC 22665]|nr:hypothetical protein H9P43_003799 [Blastocladiella emersonii ATCC 22665]
MLEPPPISALPQPVLARALILSRPRSAVAASSRLFNETIAASFGQVTLAYLYHCIYDLFRWQWDRNPPRELAQDMTVTWTSFAAAVQASIGLHHRRAPGDSDPAPFLTLALFRAFLAKLRWGVPGASIYGTVSESRQRTMLDTLATWKNDEMTYRDNTDMCGFAPDALMRTHVPLLLTEPVLSLPIALELIPDLLPSINQALLVVHTSATAQLEQDPVGVPRISFITLAALFAVLEWDVEALKVVAEFVPGPAGREPLLGLLADPRVAHAVMLQVNNGHTAQRVVAVLEYLTERGFSLDPATPGRTYCSFAAYLQPERFTSADLVAIVQHFDAGDQLAELGDQHALVAAKQLTSWASEGHALEMAAALALQWPWLTAPANLALLVWAAAEAELPKPELALLVKMVLQAQYTTLAESVFRCTTTPYSSVKGAVTVLMSIFRNLDPDLDMARALVPSLPVLCDAQFAGDLALLGMGETGARLTIAGALAAHDAINEHRHQHAVSYVLAVAPLMASAGCAEAALHRLAPRVADVWAYTYFAFGATMVNYAAPDKVGLVVDSLRDCDPESLVLASAVIWEHTDAVLAAWPKFLTYCPTGVLTGFSTTLLEQLLEATVTEEADPYSQATVQRKVEAVETFIRDVVAHDAHAFAANIGSGSALLHLGTRYLPASASDSGEFAHHFDEDVACGALVMTLVNGTSAERYSRTRHLLRCVDWTPGVLRVLAEAMAKDSEVQVRVVAQFHGLADAVHEGVAVERGQPIAAAHGDAETEL